MGPSCLGDVAIYGVSSISSSVEVLVVATVGLLAKVEVLKCVFVGDMNSSSWFEFVKTVRVGQFSEECCEVEGGDVWFSIGSNLHTYFCSCRAVCFSVAHFSCLLSSLL
jgi:hypothetical protein